MVVKSERLQDGNVSGLQKGPTTDETTILRPAAPTENKRCSGLSLKQKSATHDSLYFM